MVFVNDQANDKDHQFTQGKLAPLTTPANVTKVTRWMCQQAYGTPEPSPKANPTNAQSPFLMFLMFWEKAISFFMPNRLMPWNAVSGQGNLTRSIEVNDDQES
jgi:hypothetical protein